MSPYVKPSLQQNHPYVRRPSTLRTTIQEDIILNGVDYSSKITKNFSNIYEIHRRIATCPSGGTTILMSFDPEHWSPSLGMDTEDTKYIRITNLDDTNSIELAFTDYGICSLSDYDNKTDCEANSGTWGEASCYMIRLNAGENCILGSPSKIQNLMFNSEGGINAFVGFTDMRDLATIKANPGSNAVDLELFIASEKAVPQTSGT